MLKNKDAEVRKAHPGWAVRFEDATWLSRDHGWFRSEDAFYAKIYSSKEEAEKTLTYLRTSCDEGKYFHLPAEVIEAWQPVCESLRLEVETLKLSSIVGYLDLFDLHSELEAITKKVKAWQEPGKRSK